MPKCSKPSIEVSNIDPSVNKKALPLTEGMEFSLFGEGRIRFFSTEDLIQLAKTCKDLRYCKGLIPELSKRLLQCVVYGEEKKAKQILEAYPCLLLKKAEVKDYSGRTIIATPFQAALGAEDERMCEMMKPYFTVLVSKGEIESAQTEMKRQFDEQFPKGIECDSAEELQPIYNKLAKAIVDDDDNSEKAIQEFRIEITKHNKVKSGKHFNMQHLIAAYKAYVDNFDTINSCENQDTFWQKVIGFVQRQMPTNYAQVHCSRIKNVLDNADAFKRKLNFSCDEKFFPLSSVGVGLGFDFAVYSGCRGVLVAPGATWPVACGAWQVVVELCRTKTASLVSLERELKSTPQEPCYSVSR